MSSLIEMNEALRRQASYGLWAPAANLNRPRAGLIAALVRAIRRRHTASLLRQLDSRLLDDIGITRGQIDAIAAKAATKAVARKGTHAMPRIASLAKLSASIFFFPPPRRPPPGRRCSFYAWNRTNSPASTSKAPPRRPPSAPKASIFLGSTKAAMAARQVPSIGGV